MKKTINKKTIIAVSLTAILFLSVAWSLLAFVTVNEVATDDYRNYSRTLFVTFSEKGLTDGRFGGVAIAADAEGIEEKAAAIGRSDKTVFCFLPDKEEAAEERIEKVLSAVGYRGVIFCSANRELLEKMYQKRRTLCYLWTVKGKTEAYLGAKMGYNCAIDCAKLTEKTVENAHEKGHLIVAMNVTEEQMEFCKKLKTDFAFVAEA